MILWIVRSNRFGSDFAGQFCFCARGTGLIIRFMYGFCRLCALVLWISIDSIHSHYLRLRRRTQNIVTVLGLLPFNHSATVAFLFFFRLQPPRSVIDSPGNETHETWPNLACLANRKTIKRTHCTSLVGQRANSSVALRH